MQKTQGSCVNMLNLVDPRISAIASLQHYPIHDSIPSPTKF